MLWYGRICIKEKMTKNNTPEDGLEELIRLSQRITKKAKDTADREARKEQELASKRQVLQGLKDITVAMALEQLKIVAAPPDIVQQVNSFKTQPDSERLRVLITGMVSELEARAVKASRSNPELADIEHLIKTVSILIDLYFSLHG